MTLKLYEDEVHVFIALHCDPAPLSHSMFPKPSICYTMRTIQYRVNELTVAPAPDGQAKCLVPLHGFSNPFSYRSIFLVPFKSEELSQLFFSFQKWP